MVPLAVVTAAIMLVGWFPLTALWHQQSQLDTTSAQIKAVQRQEQALATQSKAVDTKAAATELAREQYQLVSPSSADPGLQPLVAPSSAAPLVTPSMTEHRMNNGFASRLVRTLEFWR